MYFVKQIKCFKEKKKEIFPLLRGLIWKSQEFALLSKVLVSPKIFLNRNEETQTLISHYLSHNTFTPS